MKVVAIDPTDAFQDVQSSLDRMVDELSTRYTAPARETEAVTLVKSRSTILRYLEEVITAAEYELALSLTPDLLTRFESELETAWANDVTVDLIVTPASEAPDRSYATLATNARARRGITTPVVAVADGNYSIYATQDAFRGDQDRYGVIFNRSALGFLVSAFFGTVLWTTADVTLVENGDGRVFPRRYASIRRCVKDLLDEEDPLYATIVGRDVEVGGQEVVSGTIVDLSFSPTEEVAGLTLETDHGEVTVGGRVAALEDIEAHEIHIGQDGPPSVNGASAGGEDR